MLGQRLHNFAIMRLLGEGGMSSVYEAEHELIRRKVAVKVLKSELSVDGAQVQRFFNEARATSAIRHPNIVEVIDVGRLPDGVPYLVMELLEGESLGERLERLGWLEIPHALDFAHQAASALVAAHALRIVHRDLKPDNLFLVPDERLQDRELVKVLDFGIAKLRGDWAAPPFDTMVGAVLGTPPYMSPEQCRGLPEEMDERTDVYALGIILYEMLCGRPPFLADGAGELMMMHMTEKPEPPSRLRSEISPALERVILCALEKRRDDRFDSMSDFDAALTEVAIALGAVTPHVVRHSVPAAMGGSIPASRAASSFESNTTSSANSSDAERERAVTRALSRRAAQGTGSGVVPLGTLDHPPSLLGMDAQQARDDSSVERPALAPALAKEACEDPSQTSQSLEVEVDLDADNPSSTAPAEIPVTVPPSAAARNTRRRSRAWLPVAAAVACLAAVLSFTISSIQRSNRRAHTSVSAATRTEHSQVPATAFVREPEPDRLISETVRESRAPAVAEALGPNAESAPNAESGSGPRSEVGRSTKSVAVRAPERRKPQVAGPIKPASSNSAPARAESADNSKVRRLAPPPRVAALSMSDFESEVESPAARAAPGRAAQAGAEPGYLSLDSAPWSDVFLGSNRLGTTPLIRVPLPPGKYLLTLRNPELGASTSYAVEIQAGKTVSRLVGWERK